MTAWTMLRREIHKNPLLSREDERTYIRKAQGGDRSAMNALVKSNLRLVVSRVVRRGTQHVGFMDLVQVGCEGLMVAIRKFDLTREGKLSTYAIHWIDQRIQRNCINLDESSIYRVPVHIASMPDRDTDKGSWVPLESIPVDLPDAAAEDPLKNLQAEEMRARISRALDTLPPLERRVIVTYYGLQGCAPKNLAEIGEELGVTREWVRQLKERGLAALHMSAVLV